MHSIPPVQTPPPATDKIRQALDELMDMAMDVARLVHAEAKVLAAAPPPAASPDPVARAKAVAVIAAAFDHAARTVRRTATLAKHLDAPVASPREAALSHTAARRHIIRTVQDAIGRAASGEQAEALQSELVERMDAPDIAEEIGQRPLLEIVNMIRRDLGLLSPLAGANDFTRRTPADIAALCALASRHPRQHPPGPSGEPGGGWPHAPATITPPQHPPKSRPT